MIKLPDKNVKTPIINTFDVLKYVKKLSMLQLEEERKIKRQTPSKCKEGNHKEKRSVKVPGEGL